MNVGEAIERMCEVRDRYNKTLCSLPPKTRERSDYNNDIDAFLLAIEALEKQLPKKPDADNDWIPVDEELPPFGERLQATILHREWITDYDSSWVPEKEKIHYQEYTEVCEIYPKDGMWFYTCKEDDYEGEVAYIKPAKDLGSPISEITAWKPLPEPYKQN